MRNTPRLRRCRAEIVTAWYLGVVGEGERARVVAFEKRSTPWSVADVLKPPTYCYGVYGSWTKKPVAQL